MMFVTSSDDESVFRGGRSKEYLNFSLILSFWISDEEIVFYQDEFADELTLLKSIPPGINDDNLDPEGKIHLVERLLYDNSSPRPLEELMWKISIDCSFFLHTPIHVRGDIPTLGCSVSTFLSSLTCSTIRDRGLGQGLG
ncbi:hypothetical protein Tco_1164664 [Tanacetum coccineum]